MRVLKQIEKFILCIMVTATSLSGCNVLAFDKSMNQALMTTKVVIKEYHNATPISHAQVLFNKDTNALSGWNHVETYPNEFAGLTYTTDAYRIDKKPTLKLGEYQYSTTLIKKFADWSHQHSNGITAQYSKLPFSQVAGIELVLRINSEDSSLPNVKKISKTYNHLVNDALLEKLDDGNIHLSIALVAQGKGTIEEPTFNAEYLLSLDAKKQVDNWYHVFIPASEFNRYSEVNYNQKPVSENEEKSLMLSSFRLMAETHSTKVIRNLIPNKFNDSVPKLFKEIGIEVKYIAVVKKKH